MAEALDAAAARARALATPLRAPSGETTAPDALGEEAVLLFWNPGCGHCRAMADDLRALDGGPRLLLIAAGGEEPGLPFPLLRDPDRALARAFGATGTPMAVRLDADGRPASGLVAGGGAVLALLRPRPVLEVIGAATMIDDLARELARPIPRRRALRLMAGALLAAGVRPAAASAASCGALGCNGKCCSATDWRIPGLQGVCCDQDEVCCGGGRWDRDPDDTYGWCCPRAPRAARRSRPARRSARRRRTSAGPSAATSTPRAARRASTRTSSAARTTRSA